MKHETWQLQGARSSKQTGNCEAEVLTKVTIQTADFQNETVNGIAGVHRHFGGMRVFCFHFQGRKERMQAEHTPKASINPIVDYSASISRLIESRKCLRYVIKNVPC
jgi:hypothetical protein